MTDFQLVSPFKPTGDQPRALQEIVDNLNRGERDTVLLGATGTGKTFTMAQVIARLNRTTLVIAHNKTLAAQLYSEFRSLFPNNAVEYFVSYYDYYQPEAYVPTSDTYIEKDATINDEIDRMRHAATQSLLERRDVIIVASVSCIYGIGSAEAYYGMLVHLNKGQEYDRDQVLRDLVKIQYDRNDASFHRGTFRVRGDVVEVFPASEDDRAYRLEFWGDELTDIRAVDPLRGTVLADLDKVAIFPSSHYVTPQEQVDRAIDSIRAELGLQLRALKKDGRLLEAARLEQRTRFDLEMLEQMGYCNGIENYSRHLTGREPGQPPPTLMDYFPEDYLLILDESHQMIPQIGAMYRGDRSRKTTLVDFGFRMPSALDNRPLQFEEFEQRVNQVVYLSATPGEYELNKTGGVITEQIIRPTGIVDPVVEVRPAGRQVDDLLEEIRGVTELGERVLVTTLTKRMAEDLTDYYREVGVKVQYLHSEVDTLERIEILAALRRGEFDVLVGINLLREGLDLPEVRLVAILDADKEGFLRSARALIQTTGRAARNIHGRVIMYADRVTDSMRQALDETDRRRKIQEDYNLEHGITPKNIEKALRQMSVEHSYGEHDYLPVPTAAEGAEGYGSDSELPKVLKRLEQEMFEAAESLDYEGAAALRDKIKALRAFDLGIQQNKADSEAGGWVNPWAKERAKSARGRGRSKAPRGRKGARRNIGKRKR